MCRPSGTGPTWKSRINMNRTMMSSTNYDYMNIDAHELIFYLRKLCLKSGRILPILQSQHILSSILNPRVSLLCIQMLSQTLILSWTVRGYPKREHYKRELWPWWIYCIFVTNCLIDFTLMFDFFQWFCLLYMWCKCYPVWRRISLSSFTFGRK